MGRNADKGVFITTAQYSNDAIEYANTLPNAKVVLNRWNEIGRICIPI